MTKSFINDNNILISTVIVFVIISSICGEVAYMLEKNKITALRKKVSDIGSAQAYALSRQLDRSLSATYGLASIIRQKGDIDNFDGLAADMIKTYGGISALQLAPEGIVSRIYPLEGHEKAIGHDLLNDPKRKTEAMETIKARELTLAGPFELIQGGMAVIGRNPVFIDNKFWGFTIVLIRLPELLNASNIDSLIESGYNYELLRHSPDSMEEYVFSKSAHEELKKPLKLSFKVPNGEWFLHIEPQSGWLSLTRILLSVFLVVLISTITSLIFNLRYRHSIALIKLNKHLVNEIDSRKKIEEELNQKSQELEALTQDLRKLSTQLSEQEELSRRKFARILHEQVGQNLAALKIKCIDTINEYAGVSPKMKDAISNIITTLDDTIGSTRKLTSELYPVVLDALGLVSAVSWYGDLVLKPKNIKVLTNIDELVESFPPDYKLTLFRVVQEAFQNIVKHSSASEVEVALKKVDKSIQLIIKDDGIGFDLEKIAKKKDTGIGLMLIKERAISLGGCFEVESTLKKGTMIKISIPAEKQ